MNFKIDNLQYCNWSRKIFEINREAQLDAVHVTIVYHEDFDELQNVIKSWDKHFKENSDLIFLGKDFRDIEKAKSEFWSNVPKIINKEHVDLANNMNLGKLNPVFTTKLLYDPGVRDAFHEFLQQRLTKICQAKESDIKIILKQIDDRIFPFDGNSTKIITTNFDIYAFSKRSLNQTVNIEQFFLKTPKTFQYKKRNTFKEFIDKMQDMQLSQKVYEIMQHHSHQEPRETLLFEYIDVLDKNSIDHKKVLVNEDKGTRKIRLEGGWVG